MVCPSENFNYRRNNYFCLEKCLLGQVFSIVVAFQCLLIGKVHNLCILGMYTLDFFFLWVLLLRCLVR